MGSGVERHWAFLIHHFQDPYLFNLAVSKNEKILNIFIDDWNLRKDSVVLCFLFSRDPSAEQKFKDISNAYEVIHFPW